MSETRVGVTFARAYGGELHGQAVAVPFPLMARISHKFAAEVISWDATKEDPPTVGGVTVETQWYVMRQYAINAGLLERREVTVYAIGDHNPSRYVEDVRRDFGWPDDSEVICVVGPIPFAS